MRTIWSEQGLDCGRLIHSIKPGRHIPVSELSSASDNIYIVSFGRAEAGNEYYLTSLADGMQLYKSASLAELAEKMNKGNYHPMSGADKDKVIAIAVTAAQTIR